MGANHDSIGKGVNSDSSFFILEGRSQTTMRSESLTLAASNDSKCTIQNIFMCGFSQSVE